MKTHIIKQFLIFLFSSFFCQQTSDCTITIFYNEKPSGINNLLISLKKLYLYVNQYSGKDQFPAPLVFRMSQRQQQNSQ